MAISVSTNKDGATSLYINDNLSSVDRIVWEECVLFQVEDSIICWGLLSKDCVGLTNYKNKDWQPAGAKVSLKIHGGMIKQAWSKDAGKYQDAPVPRDELTLYTFLSNILVAHDDCHLKGFISPWINPYYYEFVTSQTDAPRAKKILDETVSLLPIVGEGRLTTAEVVEVGKTLQSVGKKAYGGGNYAKSETEAERLKARLDFFTAQMSEVCEFKSLYDLSQQLASIRPANKDLSTDELLDKTIIQTVEFITLIIGSK